MIPPNRAPTWQYIEQDAALCEKLSAQANIPVAIATMLLANGLTQAEQVRDFLQPSLHKLPQPLLLKDMEKAVGLILAGLKRNALFVIFGDYDVDGVTAAAVLAVFLQEVGARIRTIIPNRKIHGYGLNGELLGRLVEEEGDAVKGAILITVDCGIGNVSEIALAKQLGFVTIITDHHRLPARLPEADAIINPLQDGCLFPDKHLAGVGLSFYMVAGIRAEMRKNDMFSGRSEPNLKKYLDLVAIGTVCDMATLQGVNRILVRVGCEVVEQTGRLGLKSLLRISSIDEGAPVSCEHIAFRLGPRINAAGRLDDANLAYTLLVSKEAGEASNLAGALNTLNEERKSISEQLYGDCCHLADQYLGEFVFSLVLAGEKWHQGVLGIVASKLVQQYCLPTVLLTEAVTDDDGVVYLKGSARSVAGFDLFAALSQCSDLLERFGGHELAAGLTLKAENLIAFSRKFESIARNILTMRGEPEKLGVFRLPDLTGDRRERFLQYYRSMEPFGVGNPEPVFVAHNCELREMQIVGDGHLRFVLYQDNKRILNGIGFNKGDLKSLLANKKIDLAFNLRRNIYRGVEHWQASFVDYFGTTTH